MVSLWIVQFATFFVAAFLLIVAAVILLSFRSKRDVENPQVAPQPEIVFLFDGDTLVDASPAAHRLLDVAGDRGNDMGRLVSFLAPRFPNLHDSVLAANELDALEVVSSDGHSRLFLGVGGGRLRIRLENTRRSIGMNPERHLVHALTDELAVLRKIQDKLPAPAWRQTTSGCVIWANAAYVELAEMVDGEGKEKAALPTLFDISAETVAQADSVQRIKVSGPNNTENRWYDCSARPIGSDLLFMAIPADRILEAERKLRDFSQTLTQTFAHLDVGLAIFDRSRQLSIFNPALTDLLGLAPDYLISRPTLFQILDRLRESRMMPEPKDYKTWRNQMSDLEAAAVDGNYSETWTLEDGRTYRVTGRPHPDGAVAFLYENITAEISLSRQFRSELEIGQAVIDSLDEAIAVFSPAGYLTVSNQAYAEMWDFDPSTSLGDINILEASRRWQKSCAPTPVWGDARDFTATLGERSNWTAEVRQKDGRHLYCRFEALPGGSTLIAFSEPVLNAFVPAGITMESARA